MKLRLFVVRLLLIAIFCMCLWDQFIENIYSYPLIKKFSYLARMNMDVPKINYLEMYRKTFAKLWNYKIDDYR